MNIADTEVSFERVAGRRRVALIIHSADKPPLDAVTAALVAVGFRDPVELDGSITFSSENLITGSVSKIGGLLL